jgi:hypothetical protein
MEASLEFAHPFVWICASLQGARENTPRTRTNSLEGFVMRFAALATVFAAVVATPLVWSASAPSMNDAEFLNATRCVAYQSMIESGQGWTQAGLNAEARRQPAAIVAQARTDVSAIAAFGASVRTDADEANLRRAADAACARGRAGRLSPA